MDKSIMERKHREKKLGARERREKVPHKKNQRLTTLMEKKRSLRLTMGRGRCETSLAKRKKTNCIVHR